MALFKKKRKTREFCPKCGNPIDIVNDNYCMKCGYELKKPKKKTNWLKGIILFLILMALLIGVRIMQGKPILPDLGALNNLTKPWLSLLF